MNRKNYSSLIRELALTDFKLKYQGSVLGYLWSLAKPLAEFTVLYLVFAKVFKIGSDIPHYPIYLLLGVLLFNFWGEATSSGMFSIVSRGDLIRKVYFPRIILVISSSVTAFITLLLNSLVIFVFAYVNKMDISFSAVKALIYFGELYLFVLGVSFYLAALFVKFRDIGHIWEVINRILFYATPILYSLSQVPNKYAKLMVLNPLAQIIMDVRKSFMGVSLNSVESYWSFPYIPIIFVFTILITGYLLFQKMANRFAEEV